MEDFPEPPETSINLETEAINSENPFEEETITGAIPPDVLVWAKDEIYNLISNQSVGPSSMQEHWEAFTSAINWKEPFIITLVIFHLLLWFISILTMKNPNFQIVLFLFCSLCVYIGEYINKILSQGLWEAISTQNYFDPRGVFAMMMFSGPLIFLLTFLLGNMIYQSMQMLVILKRAQLAEKRKKEDKIDNKISGRITGKSESENKKVK